MKEIKGAFYLGAERVRLMVENDNSDGCFYFCYEDGGVPVICVGINGNWNRTVSILMHEAMEFVLTRLQCRYQCSDDMGRDHSEYTFHMRHYQFSDACAKVSEFMAGALPELSRAHKANQPKAKKP